MTQKEMVLKYINDNGSITTLEAFVKLYVCDLQKIIQLLRVDHNIKDEWIQKVNIYGKPIKYKKYYIEEK